MNWHAIDKRLFWLTIGLIGGEIIYRLIHQGFLL